MRFVAHEGPREQTRAQHPARETSQGFAIRQLQRARKLKLETLNAANLLDVENLWKKSKSKFKNEINCHRSISPRTISKLPRMARTSDINHPPAISFSTPRAVNAGERILSL